MSRIIRRCIATIREWCMIDSARRWHGLDDVPDDYLDRTLAILTEN
jgi:hypothetical protein